MTMWQTPEQILPSAADVDQREICWPRQWDQWMRRRRMKLKWIMTAFASFHVKSECLHRSTINSSLAINLIHASLHCLLATTLSPVQGRHCIDIPTQLNRCSCPNCFHSFRGLWWILRYVNWYLLLPSKVNPSSVHLLMGTRKDSYNLNDLYVQRIENRRWSP